MSFPYFCITIPSIIKDITDYAAFCVLGLCPFEIMKIRQDPDHCRAMIGLRRLGSKTDQPIIEVPAYLDHLEPNDAYWLLKRYDQPY